MEINRKKELRKMIDNVQQCSEEAKRRSRRAAASVARDAPRVKGELRRCEAVATAVPRRTHLVVVVELVSEAKGEAEAAGEYVNESAFGASYTSRYSEHRTNIHRHPQAML